MDKKTMNETVVYKNMIDEAAGTSQAIVDVIRNKRGGPFRIVDAQPYVDVVNKMTAVEGQSEDVIALYVDSVNAHYDVLKGLTDTVRPEDDPFIEAHQTPAILEILYEEDPDFKASMWKFIDAIAGNRAMVGLEAARKYGGMYGPTCVVDFGMSVGSMPNLFNRLLVNLDIPLAHKQTIMASKSWGMNTAYTFASALRKTLESGGTLAEAEQAEIDWLQYIHREPIASNAQMMDEHNLGGHGPHSSFDVRKYMQQYKERMRPTVVRAMKAGVHEANIACVTAFCAGDIAHHISESGYNMFRDHMVFGIYEAVIDVMENTLRRGLEQGAYKSVYDVVAVATGATACATTYLLWLDSFTVPMVVDLFTKRFYNHAAMHPDRGEEDEIHGVDFLDMIARGERILDVTPIGSGAKVKGVAIDLSPIHDHEVLMNPQRYSYASCAHTQRFAALMTLADFPCYLTPEPTTASLMTNIIALEPTKPGAPMRGCKQCAVTSLIKRNVPMVTGRGGGTKGYCEWQNAI